ncbi:ADP-ribosylglycohydrolase family protein [Luteibacter sahnii]|uniref:ADP-ribosylglycohydrolase family protein n=1 Tax=Luteibacter sahnii TaxID=3021977 RepID=UPI002A6B8D23|nr:ADP-ribosylglycohydrolase family protein [Luteibacter sp. PPL193]
MDAGSSNAFSVTADAPATCCTAASQARSAAAHSTMPESAPSILGATMETPESIDVRRDRLAGGLQGLLIGDALGVPYEFHEPLDVPRLEQIDIDPPKDFPRSHQGVPPGTWSDDGAQALCLLQSLLAKGTLDLGDFSRRLVNWADWGHLAVDGHVFDIGLQTARAIERLRAGVPPEHAGGREAFDNGNGSLMRVLPLALWHTGDDVSLVAMAAQQSLPTHAHPRAAVACAFLCLWARAELAAKDWGWAWAEATLRQHGPDVGLPAEDIEIVLDRSWATRVQGSGYVVDTLWSARQALDRATGYADAVRYAVSFGHDTDTTAAVAGGIAGIRYGLHGIPSYWRERLRGKELFAELQGALIRHACACDGDGDGEPAHPGNP